MNDPLHGGAVSTIITFTGGNTRLKPENSYSYFTGATWTPGPAIRNTVGGAGPMVIARANGNAPAFEVVDTTSQWQINSAKNYFRLTL